MDIHPPTPKSHLSRETFFFCLFVCLTIDEFFFSTVLAFFFLISFLYDDHYPFFLYVILI